MPVMAAPVHLPAPVDPASQEHHAGKVIFAELVTPDLDAAERFYGELFGWKFRDVQPEGPLCRASLDGRPVAGLVQEVVPGDCRQPAWLTFFASRCRCGQSLCFATGGQGASGAAFLIVAGKPSSQIRRVLFLPSRFHSVAIRLTSWLSPANGFGVRS